MAELEISPDINRIDFHRLHSWLTTAYWSLGVTRERVERAARNSSLVLGAYLDGNQVGYLRVVSDKTTFAWICDVWVDSDFRGQGIAKKLVRAALEDPDHQGLRRWVLATTNAHEVYAQCGFEPLPQANKWMALKGSVPLEAPDPANLKSGA